MISGKLSLFVSCTITLLACTSIARGEVLDVPSEYATIRTAIEAAFPGDEIVLAPGTYVGPDNRALSTLGKAITIRSADGPETCIIDCKDDGRAFQIVSGEGPETVIDGLTIRNGRAGRGGAIWCENSSPTIRNTLFEFNTATRGQIDIVTGGALLVIGGAPRIDACRFATNRGQIGAAIGGFNSSIQITDSRFYDNVNNLVPGSKGGAVALVQEINDVSVAIRGSSFSFNRATSGGAIYCERGTLRITDCDFDSNSLVPPGATGGAIFVNGTTFELNSSVVRNSPIDAIFSVNANSTIKESAFLECGGPLIAQGSGTSFVANCAFVECEIALNCGAGHSIRATNTTINGGDGNYVFFVGTSAGLSFSNGTVVNSRAFDDLAYAPVGGFVARNSVFWNNRTRLRDDRLQRHDIRNCIVQGGFPGENFDIDPRFRDLIGPDGIAGTIDDDLRPIPGGPAVDHGNSSFVPRDLADIDNDGDTIERLPIDLAGNVRIADDPFSADGPFGTPPNVDIGAFEVNRPCEIVGDNDADGDVDLTDLCYTLHHYGTPSGRILGDGDLDQDGDVDLIDLAGLLVNFGMNCES